MASISAGLSKTITLAIGQSVTFSPAGSGVAVLSDGQQAGVVYSLGESTQTIGPFSQLQRVSVSASATLTYNVSSQSTATASTDYTALATGTALAFRSSQASNGNLIDQGPNANVMSTVATLSPVAWLANAAVTLNSYRTKPAADGKLYKCTTAGTNGATEPTWNATIGGTTTSGTAVYTTEKGPYLVDGDGIRLVRSLASTQVGAAAAHSLPAAALQWDMALGQSLIAHLRIKFDYAASGQAAASPILSNRELTGTNRGFRIVGTGTPFNDLRFNVRDSLGNSILSDNFSSSFARKPLDGTERSIVMMIDGALKMMFVYIDGIAVTQADMFSGASICPNGMNLASITGSTQGGALTIGGDPLGTTSIECAFKTGDVTPLPGGLPANIQNIASWYARGGEGVIPQYLLD